MRKGSFLFTTLFAIAIGLLASCHNGDQKQMKETAQSFSDAYFNWQFRRAMPYVTADSRRWLSYASSQVTEQDVDSLRAMSQGATTTLKSAHFNDGDTTASVVVLVDNYLPMDSIGKTGRVVASGTFVIPMSYDKGKWKVRLKALPRPERD